MGILKNLFKKKDKNIKLDDYSLHPIFPNKEEVAEEPIIEDIRKEVAEEPKPIIVQKEKKPKIKKPKEVDDMKMIPKKRRKKALMLLEEYNKGLVIKIDADVNQKELITSLRKVD